MSRSSSAGSQTNSALSTAPTWTRGDGALLSYDTVPIALLPTLNKRFKTLKWPPKFEGVGNIKVLKLVEVPFLSQSYPCGPKKASQIQVRQSLKRDRGTRLEWPESGMVR